MSLNQYLVSFFILSIATSFSAYGAENNIIIKNPSSKLKDLDYKETISTKLLENPLKDLPSPSKEDKVEKICASYQGFTTYQELFPSKRYTPPQNKIINSPDHVLGIEDAMDRALQHK